MPLYKYQCSDCENIFRVLKKNGQKDEVPECPECGSTDVEKMISRVGIRFKGSGFYRTDYDGNSNYKNNGGNGKKDEDSKESGNEGASEAKESCASEG